MTRPGKLLKSKTKFNREELATLLETIAARVRAGSLPLGEGSDALKMELPARFTVEMEVKDSGRRQLKRELELAVEWQVEDDGTPIDVPGPASGFTIS